MKRYLFVFVCLLFVLVGCGGAETETAVAPTDPPPTATPIPPTPTPLPPTAEPETAVNAELAAALQAVVDEQVANGFPGVLLMVEAPDMDFTWHGAGGWANEDAGVTMTPDTLFRVNGVTHMMTASVLLRMAEEGMLELDDPISQYLDAEITDLLNGPDDEPYGDMITIRQVIGNTSGVAGYFLIGVEDMNRNTSPDFVDAIVDVPDKTWLPEEIIAASTEKIDPSFAPGESIGSSYDVEQVLLGLVIEEVTDASLNEAYQTWLFEPLGMTETFLARTDDPRKETAAHVYYGATDVSDYASLSWLSDDLVTTMDDLSRFMWAWVNDDIFTTPESKEAMMEWNSLAEAGWDGLYYGLGVLNVRFGEWGVPEIGDVLGNISVWNGFVNYWPQYNVVFAGTLNQAKPLESYTILQGATIQTVLPYVAEG